LRESKQGSDSQPGSIVGCQAVGTSRSHLLTVVLEDYFHVAPLKSVVKSDQWYRFERRVEANTRTTLDLLDEFGVSATFFVLGSIADEMPEIVREVVNRGHEIASKGYVHRSIHRCGPSEFRDDLVRSREALERASGTKINGFRIGHEWFEPQDLWALDILVSEGFAYDSSVRPLYWKFAREPWRLTPHRHHFEDSEIWEFPVTAWTLGGWSFPISGGNYFRQFPHWMMRRAVDAWTENTNAPFMMYFHVWEMDPDQPRILAAPLWERIRQYRNLSKMDEIVRYYLERYRFMGIGEYLGLPREVAEQVASSESAEDASVVQVTDRQAPISEPVAPTPITVVVPCFNEELILPYLANTLRSVEQDLESQYELFFIFVDDGSTDGTWSSLEKLFGQQPHCLLVRHQENRGVAAAIMTGIGRAETDIACSIDCDCTYDPHQLQRLIPLLTDDVDMVTASPYHEEGVVRNVPSWRLFLSKSLSRLYRRVLHHRLATYTSCFRVYRRAAVTDLHVRNGGFLGVAEMLGRLDLQGGNIVECPAILEVRLLGRSKMKTLNSIAGHLGLLAWLAKARLVSFLGKERINRDPASAGPESEFKDPVSDSEAENQSSDQRS
jgi:polysaccharide deacetylase family protein (PEP-CTERM system associated)